MGFRPGPGSGAPDPSVRILPTTPPYPPDLVTGDSCRSSQWTVGPDGPWVSGTDVKRALRMTELGLGVDGRKGDRPLKSYGCDRSWTDTGSWSSMPRSTTDLCTSWSRTTTGQTDASSAGSCPGSYSRSRTTRPPRPVLQSSHGPQARPSV